MYIILNFNLLVIFEMFVIKNISIINYQLKKSANGTQVLLENRAPVHSTI